jgi:uncharacterized protein (TIGR00159 family)
VSELLKRLFAERPLAELLRDVVDIVIVAWVIYRGLLVLRGTRAIQMAVGLGIVLLVYVGANVFKLATLRGLLASLLGSIVLIVVVVFQNDIRRALIRMGNTSWFTGGREQQSRVIDEVVAAATELARHRMGALIAFEQDANVLEFAKSEGIQLDSVVTRELLVSLFVPESVNKLHDGAILIRDLRIARAGVFFPMPDAKVLDAQLGSRHRAALGITEETDAVVVVVSEERGTISFCFSGNIVSNLDGPSLRHALLGLFGRAARKKVANKGGASKTPESERAERGERAEPRAGRVPPAAATPTPAIRPPAAMNPPAATQPSGGTTSGKAITPAPGKLMATAIILRAGGDAAGKPVTGSALRTDLEAGASRPPFKSDPDAGPPSSPPASGRSVGATFVPSVTSVTSVTSAPPKRAPDDGSAPAPEEDA